jgi:hypothetical protein
VGCARCRNFRPCNRCHLCICRRISLDIRTYSRGPENRLDLQSVGVAEKTKSTCDGLQMLLGVRRQGGSSIGGYLLWG